MVQCYFLLMATLQAAVVLWLHHRTLRRNLQELRHHLALSSLGESGPAWVEAGSTAYSFRICDRCVDRVMTGRTAARAV